MNQRSRPVLVAVAIAALSASCPAAPEVTATNILANGSFGDLEPSLDGWRTDFTADKSRWHMQNHSLVSVIPREGVRQNVLRLHVATKGLADNQGVKADSMPVPFEYGARYRLSVSARSTGPNCRILIEGYQWRPGIKPHPNPDFHALRKVYRQGAGSMLYFGNTSSGPFSGPERTWSTGSCTFPGDALSSAAKAHLRRVRFLSVHVIGIGGRAGELFVDDVRLEPIASKQEGQP